MRMHMPGTERLQPGQQPARLEQIDHMVRPRPIGTQAHAQRQPQRRKKASRLRAQHLQHRPCQRFDSALQHIVGLGLLGHVLGIHQLRIPAAQGNALHFKALTLQCQNLATNEAMADFGVLIDEVSDTHKHQAWLSLR
ncbi:hypothetical protein D3C84_874810 [compost metagenome]